MYSNQDPEEQFELNELIGQGAYAKVYKGRHKNGQIVAIKIVPSNGEIQSLIKEIQILKQECQHAHIVQYYGSFYKDGNLWLVMEYCVGGSIIDLLKITQKTLTESEIAAILYHVLLGIEYLHANKKIHRDIKAGNILLDEKGTIKIADFGVAAQLIYTNADKGTVIGTPVYMSPEVISKNRYNHLTDIWSLGVTAIELAEGKPPYSHIHPVRAMFAIKNNPPQGLTNPEKWSKEFNDFVKSCLRVQVSERPSAQQLLQSPFIKQGKQDQKKLVNLIENFLNQIDEYRQSKSQENLENVQTLISKQENSEDEEQSCGTVVECGTLVIKEEEVQSKGEKELDFVTYAKKEKIINEIIDEQLSDEQQMENMNQDERKKFLAFLHAQMEEEISKVKQKYMPKIEMLTQKIKSNESPEPTKPQQQILQTKPQLLIQTQQTQQVQQQQQQPQKIEVAVPFQVNPDVLQKLSNMKIPQIKIQNVSSPTAQLRSNPKQKVNPEYLVKQNINSNY
ncbi:unnamed protein product (macronuclear) [Paramecium tetraurelia]|uniref:non-specific serine/threonine protein kinase n=1 Tax=Paramecium tetraurelia TaxID=5888 RepID=A0E889_PARTE|nr:uncharacterized protein GSPATT00024234001 [Paramecium tetraurelia]CAK91506.1 unnamed protein product [Paramecium tetraurelia]|eukprot:XP_001458903.1 hypothetical protein (macronuclear) [Paramecium tetraurelia strain d4-2]